MHYENRQPPEGINVVAHGWKKDFILLVVGFFASVALLCWLLLLTMAWVAKWTPFSWEHKLAHTWFTPQQDERTLYLKNLAEALGQAGGLSPEVTVTVHYSPGTATNAFATLGGNILVLEGLLKNLTSEQGLAFVLAHEIAHVHHRDPVRAVVRGLSLSVVSGLIFGKTDLANLAGMGGNLVLLDYSRQQEMEADIWALRAVQRHYGHVAGADELFLALLQQTPEDWEVPEWLASHPELRNRIRYLGELARENGFLTEGERAPLPEFLTREDL